MLFPHTVSAYSKCLKSTSYDLDAQSVIHGSVSSTSPSLQLAMQSLRPQLEVKNSYPSFKKGSQVICTHTEISAALSLNYQRHLRVTPATKPLCRASGSMGWRSIGETQCWLHTFEFQVLKVACYKAVFYHRPWEKSHVSSTDTVFTTIRFSKHLSP